MLNPFINMTEEEAKIFMLGNKHPIREFVADKVGERKVLDLGCGRGIKICELYSVKNYTGVDCSKELIKVAKEENVGYNFIVSDIVEYLKEIKDKSIPVIIMISVLEHVSSLEVARRIYDEAERAAQVFYLGWHTPPVYSSTEILKVKAELNEPIWQNRYVRGSFPNPLRVEKVHTAEFWTVCS